MLARSPTHHAARICTGKKRDCKCDECVARRRANHKRSYENRKDRLLVERKAAYWTDPEAYRARAKAQRERTGKQYRKPRDVLRAERLLRCYGLTVEAYNAMLDSQGHRCLLCFAPVFDRHSNLALVPNVDHDHQTGKTREILCMHCNNGLGAFKDNVEVMAKAIAYVLKHRR